jgi:conjugal transfer mating pair stabilization protein TraN
MNQCSDIECFFLASKPTEKTNPDMSSYQNDGTFDQATGNCEGSIYIFNGKGKECRTAGISTSFFNCCSTDPGSFLFIRNNCGSEEAETVQQVDAGMCRYIGDYCKEKWPLIGCVQRANTYCCFNSKLGRIIHEQGRLQLQQFGASGNWGSPENPNCRGLTPEEFQMLDFSQIDLSEYFGDIRTKAVQEIQQKMEGKVREYYQNVR